MARQGEYQLEILPAFAGRRKKSNSRSQKTAALAWMYSQCSGTEPQLFSVYSRDISKIPPFEHQSYHYWKTVVESERFAHPIRYRRRTILIQPMTHSQASSGYKHTEIHPSVLSHLCSFCKQFFHGMTIEVAPPIDLSQIRKLTRRVHETTNREQFLVSDIRKFLQSTRPSKAFCILGVTVADLYPSPEWNFVLGEASMAQGCGVFSFGRYFNSSTAASAGATSSDGEAWGGNNGETEQLRNLWVLMRVMSHELCHIFGLKHCYYFNCAMNESSSIVEAATQPLFLCPICLRKMQKAVGFDPLERYRQLLHAIKQLQSAVLEASCSVTDKKERNNIESEMLGATVDVNQVSEVSERVWAVTEANREGVDVHDCDDSGDKELMSNDCNQSDGNDAKMSGGMEHVHESDIQGCCASQNDTGLTDIRCASCHSEQFEEAVVWLKRVVSSLGQFEDQWVEQGEEQLARVCC